MTDSEQSAANCLAMCVAWQESRVNDYLARDIFTVMERLKSLVPSNRNAKKAMAKGPRPGAKKPLKQAIIAMFRSQKHKYKDFKTFMQAWELAPLYGLRISYKNSNEKYVISDEDAKLGKVEYSWATLEKMHSQLR